MRPLRLILILLTLLIVAFVAYSAYQREALKKEFKKRRPLKSVQVEKPMVVLVPSYNNSLYCIRNLRSIFDQRYSNFRVIYIDDASKDDTYEKVCAFLQTARKDIDVQLIRNEKNRGALSNIYNAVQTCKDEEIVLTVDGDDHLAHERVLETLNRIYAHTDVWMTYGNFLNYPTFTQTPVSCKQIPLSVVLNNGFRHSAWVSSHLRTFYAALFKKIRLQDFLYEGAFFPMAWDLAFMIPMLEMSGKHAQFIKEVLYLYNRENPISDHVKNLALQSACHGHVVNLPRYQPLHSLNFSNVENKESVDLVIFSFDRPMQLFALLESIEAYATGLNSIDVIYRTSSQEYETAYKEVFARFPKARPIHEEKGSFRRLCLNSVAEAPSPYIAFAVDDLVLTRSTNFALSAQALSRTQGYGFYLSNGLNLRQCYMKNKEQPLPLHIALDHGIYAWQFKQGEADWNYPHTLDLCIYRKADVQKDLQALPFHNPPTLESSWAHKGRSKRVGLFFATSSCVNIPLNLVAPSHNRFNNHYTPKELLTLFNQGLKIDITPLKGIDNPSRHIDYLPTLIPR